MCPLTVTRPQAGSARWRAIDGELGLGSLKAGLRACQAAGLLGRVDPDAVAHLISGAVNEAVFPWWQSPPTANGPWPMAGAGRRLGAGERRSSGVEAQVGLDAKVKEGVSLAGFYEAVMKGYTYLGGVWPARSHFTTTMKTPVSTRLRARDSPSWS